MKTVLITGASSGIGKELAYIFASKKAFVILVSRNSDKLDDLATLLEERYECKSAFISADLSKEEERLKVYQTCQQNNWHVDYLINNAGFGDGGLFANSNWDKLGEMIDLNIKGLTHLCHLFIPAMRQNNFGRILNVASLAAFMPGPNMAVYYASKAFVLHFSEAISIELKDENISVTALCPGPTHTGFSERADMEKSELFNNEKVASAKDVASFGFKAMMNGWRVAIPGIQNMLLAKASRIAPRSFVMNTAKKLNE